MMGLLDGIFGGGSSSTNKSNVTTTAPWSAAQPAMKLALADAQKAYKSGVGSQVYTGSTVIPYAQQTVAGMNDQMAAAGRAQPGLDAAFKQQQNVASGQMLNANPYIDQVIGNSADDIARQYAMESSGAGRYGSGGFQGVRDMAIGRMASGVRNDNYRAERAAQDAAATGLGATYQNTLAPGSTKMDVGARYEDLATRQKQDELRIFDAKQNQPWNQIARLNNISNSAAGTGSTTTAQGPSRVGSALGGALGGYATTGGLGGTLLGALAGYM